MPAAFNCEVQDIRQCNPLNFQCHLPFCNAGNVEQIFHQTREVGHRTFHSGMDDTRLIRGTRAAKKVHRAHERCDRVAQFVGKYGKKPILRAIGLAKRGRRRRQLIALGRYLLPLPMKIAQNAHLCYADHAVRSVWR
ncbi:hypothetical protein LH128_06972 [Sphingomonas sp. LH128]|nr:hypothetical protein LH128_06972 [Sphingomonas sp. LH128]